MTFARPRILLTVSLGLIVSSFSAASALAEEESKHSNTAGHDHDAMKAEKKISDMLATLATADRKQAVAQRFCPVMEYSRLGAMDAPHKIMIEGTPVYVCCEGCIDDAVEGGKETLVKVKKLTKASASLADMPAVDRAAAEVQKYCAISNKNLLGSMGTPIKLEFDGKPVFLCCKGCVAKAKADPAATLAKVEALKKAGKHEGHGHSDHDHKGHGHSDHKH